MRRVLRAGRCEVSCSRVLCRYKMAKKSSACWDALNTLREACRGIGWRTTGVDQLESRLSSLSRLILLSIPRGQGSAQLSIRELRTAASAATHPAAARHSIPFTAAAGEWNAESMTSLGISNHDYVVHLDLDQVYSSCNVAKSEVISDFEKL